ncbi:methyl-accepting chemotaxis protein [Desulfomonile tiedjei]|uniref:Methyl-accepting chemotaxis protein n=1 Tax=Desulfomonile tiedjei (strain ATCC 49306 / DSM 6799 / DCB-1) TaxID=706587 RepID=I4C0E5_DESTA|nr:methyl-accepting chemotaxis protein [Desulfomonile tiedjei]AFM23036.1 methyl-accepting chemotaxis protein [Desulfomonile tiedjei DSM 6799]
MNNLKLRTMLAVAGLILGLIVCIIGIFLQPFLQNTEDDVSINRAVRAAQKELSRMESGLVGYMISGRQTYMDRLTAARKNLENNLTELKKSLSGNPEHEKRVQAIGNALALWQNKVVEPAINLKRKKEISEQEIRSAITGIVDDDSLGSIRSLFLELAAIQQESGTPLVGKTLKTHWKTVIIAVLMVLILTVGTFYLIGYHIAKGMLQVAEMADEVRKGELFKRIDLYGFQEATILSTTFNKMAEGLGQSTRLILEGINVLKTSVNQIAAAASELYASATQTASAVTETTSTVSEMEGTAKIVNETARKVSEHSRNSDETAEEGTHATKETVQKMNLIKDKMELVRSTVMHLSETTRYVEDIIAAVDDLHDQSNLLAVNASMEAARAGEHGRSFGVVAHEIKSLSDQSRAATEQVSRSLYDIRKSVAAVVSATEEGAKAVQSGVEQSQTAGDSIEKLAGSIREFSQASNLIFVSTEKQFARVARVSSTMKGVEAAMNSSLQSTTQLEDEARRLEQLALALQGLVQEGRAKAS